MSSTPKMVKSANGPGFQLPSQDGVLTLGLRVRKINQEVQELDLPIDLREFLEGALADRELSLECKYRQVCRWIAAQNRGSFWLDFGCKSLDELWARLDLPGGTALANWEIIIRLFSKETFLLVGDDELGYMVRYIATYEPDIESRKQTYRKIFDGYCRQYSAFDKNSFRRHVNRYVNQYYVAPRLDKDIENRDKTPPRLVSKGVTLRREAVEAEVVPGPAQARVRADSASPIASPPLSRTVKDFIIRADRCAGCKECDSLMIAAMAHLTMLEDRLRQLGGPKSVPARPSCLSDSEITNYFRQRREGMK